LLLRLPIDEMRPVSQTGVAVNRNFTNNGIRDNLQPSRG
jgi:hypothetical protein